MALRLYAVVLLFSPLVLAPVFVFKAPLWTHTNGMLGAGLGVCVALALSTAMYYSEAFSKDLLAHRGAINRRSLWRVLCGVETNAELWLLAVAEGYWFGLNFGAFLQSLARPLEVALPLSVFAAVAMLVQGLFLVGFCFAPLLRVIGLTTTSMHSPLESLLCGATAIVLGEFLGCAFAAYIAAIYVLGQLAKETVFVYVLGIYAALAVLVGLGVTLKAVVDFILRRCQR